MFGDFCILPPSTSEPGAAGGPPCAARRSRSRHWRLHCYSTAAACTVSGPTVVCDLAGIHTDTYTVSRRWHWLMWSHASKHAHEQPGVDSSSGSRESGGTRARDVLPLSLAKERKKERRCRGHTNKARCLLIDGQDTTHERRAHATHSMEAISRTGCMLGRQRRADRLNPTKTASERPGRVTNRESSEQELLEECSSCRDARRSGSVIGLSWTWTVERSSRTRTGRRMNVVRTLRPSACAAPLAETRSPLAFPRRARQVERICRRRFDREH